MMVAFDSSCQNRRDETRRDAFAGPLRSEVQAAKTSFGRAVESLLGHRADTADHIEAALASDPDLAAGYLLRGFALRVLGRRDLQPGIQSCLQAAQRSFITRGSEPRERALFDTLSLWCDGDLPQAAATLDSHLCREPKDLLAIKLSHALRFIMGDNKGMLESLESVLPFFRESTPGQGFVLGCRAFALEETGAWKAAEQAGRRALELEPKDVWALHAVAHVYFEQGQPLEGVRWLRAREPLLEGVNNFAGHVAWHEALFHVQDGRPEIALSLYDRRIAIYPPRDYRDVSNASSLLLLLDERGFDLKERWSTLAEVALERLGDHGLAFADIHYVLALVSSGRLRDARRFLGSMRQAIRDRDDFDADVSRQVGIPLATMIVEARAGRMTQAWEMFRQLPGSVDRLGGSHAQRRVIDWLFRNRLKDSLLESSEARM